MRVVFDTNVFVAAFVTQGICAKLLTRARRSEFLLFTSPHIVREFEDVLTGKFSATRNEVGDARKVLLEAVHEIMVPAVPVTAVCRDPDDDQILACALAAKADCLVSGDSDLLELKEFGRTRILPPRDLELLIAD
jgi:uncharacterized protein